MHIAKISKFYARFIITNNNTLIPLPHISCSTEANMLTFTSTSLNYNNIINYIVILLLFYFYLLVSSVSFQLQEMSI